MTRGRRPVHIISGAIVFSLGLGLGIANLAYVIEFLTGAAQPVLLGLGSLALLSGLLRRQAPFARVNLVLGGLFLILGLYGVYDEYHATMDMLHGAGPLVMLSGGILVLAHGIRQLRQKGQNHE